MQWLWLGSSVHLAVSLFPSISTPFPFLTVSHLYLFVLDRLAPPWDLWFMAASVSHNKAVSNEVKEGDLCVHITQCAVCVCVSLFPCFLCYKGRVPVSWMVSNQWWALKCWIHACAVCLGTQRKKDWRTERRQINTHGGWLTNRNGGTAEERNSLMKEHTLTRQCCTTNKCRPNIPPGTG